MADHPPARQPAPAIAPDYKSLILDGLFVCALLIFLLLMIYFLTPYISLIFHVHPHAQPLPPIVTLYSFTATTLSITTFASWNLTLSVSNPNPKSSIYYENFTMGVYYSNHSNNNSNIVFVGDKDFGKFDQPVNGYNSLSSNLTFSIRNLGKKEMVKKFMEDQKNGSIGVTIKASYRMNLKKYENWKMMNIFCGGVMIYFQQQDENKTDVFGTASPLPAMFQFYNP